MTKKSNCKSCKYWKNEQAGLDYSSGYGYCICPVWKFNVQTDEDDVKLIDRQNPSGKHMNVHTFENASIHIPVGKVETSRYVFATGANFGCIHFKK